ncbi:MAG: IF-2 protein [Myxococcaceae bacterium]|nr:IF-2 protein [Myxococcaceae bacterium]
MSPTPPQDISFGARLWRALVRLTVTTLLLCMAGAAIFFWSQLNARTYTLEVREGKLWVLKGRMAPTGYEPWNPSDPAMVDAYAPLELDGSPPMGMIGQRFTDRDELDRALFSILEGLAKPRVLSDDANMLERGVYLLRRADRLTGITDEQKHSLKAMKADVAFYTARIKLEDAQKQIEEALIQLRLAAQNPNRHNRAANQMITAIEPETKAMTEALRKALHTLSAPPPAPVEPTVPVLDAGAP